MTPQDDGGTERTVFRIPYKRRCCARQLDLTTREAARAAIDVLVSDRRWVTRLQGAYGAMYGRLGQSFGSMYSFHHHISVVRDTREASSLTCDIREVLRQSPMEVKRADSMGKALEQVRDRLAELDEIKIMAAGQPQRPGLPAACTAPR